MANWGGILGAAVVGMLLGRPVRTHWRFWLGQKWYQSGIIAMPSVTVSRAPFLTCDFCRSVYIGDPCPSCGARQFKVSSTLGERETGRQFYMDLSINIVIDNQWQFYVSLDCNPSYATKGPVKMWCHLEGLHARGVQ